MNLEPALPASSGQAPIQRYGGGGFRIGGEDYLGSVLIFPNEVRPWAGAEEGKAALDGLSSLLAPFAAHILLVGCGRQFVPPPVDFVKIMRAAGVHPEWMDTGAACRTFNVLISEDREVIAALVAVS